jgi:hypothetical protein
MAFALRQRASFLNARRRVARLAAIARARLIDDARVGQWEQIAGGRP